MLKRFSLAGLILLGLAAPSFGRTPRELVDLPIPSPGGKPIDLKQYRGKVVLLAMITPTCKDCLGSLDLFNRLQKDFGPMGFQMVAACVNANAKNDAGPLAQRYKLNFPVGYLDKPGFMQIADVGGDQKPFVPIVMFIDRTGVVRFQYFGNDRAMKDKEKSIRAIVDGLVRQVQRKTP